MSKELKIDLGTLYLYGVLNDQNKLVEVNYICKKCGKSYKYAQGFVEAIKCYNSH